MFASVHDCFHHSHVKLGGFGGPEKEVAILLSFYQFHKQLRQTLIRVPGITFFDPQKKSEIEWKNFLPHKFVLCP